MLFINPLKFLIYKIFETDIKILGLNILNHNHILSWEFNLSNLDVCKAMLSLQKFCKLNENNELYMKALEADASTLQFVKSDSNYETQLFSVETIPLQK